MSLPTPQIPLDSILSLRDFESAAEATLKPKSWAYYHSAADDSDTMKYNNTIYSQVRFRPRVLKDVENVDTTTYVMGNRCALPCMISPAAMGGLAHRDAEKCLVRGAGRTGIPYTTSTYASISHKDLAAEMVEEQTLFFQLYVNRDRSKSEKALKEAKALGFKAVVLTVDTPFPGNRELDNRTEIDSNTAVSGGSEIGSKESAIALSSQATDPALIWEDIAWARKASGGLPIILKGIQCVEDAKLAVQFGCEGIMLSNHGGRQVDTASTPLETLLEIRRYHPEILNQTEIILDSGIRRGTDVVIALALGAKAVSIGRPFMYSLIYGDEGVVRLAHLLGEEVARAMRLLGCCKIADLNPSLVNTKALERQIFSQHHL